MVKFMYQGTKLFCRLERQSPRAHRLRRVTNYTRPGIHKCCANRVVVPYYKRKEGNYVSQRRDSNPHIPTNLTGLEPDEQLPHCAVSVYFGIVRAPRILSLYQLS